MPLNWIELESAEDIPSHLPPNTALRLRARDRGPDYRRERLDRNYPYVLLPELDFLHDTIIAIAGVGGMGGTIAERMLRVGIGTIRIADPEDFDLSNVGRQFGATLETVGWSKALATARALWKITDDLTIEAYPQGVRFDMLSSFLEGASILNYEIEFWNIGAGVQLHQEARHRGLCIYDGLTVNLATYLHLFTPESMPVEEMLGLTLDEAIALERAFLSGALSAREQASLMDRIMRCFIPDPPEYFTGPEGAHRNKAVYERLASEGKAPIVSTNPPVAAGIVADRILLQLLEEAGHAERAFTPLLPTPACYRFDAATLEGGFIHRTEVRHAPT